MNQPPRSRAVFSAFLFLAAVCSGFASPIPDDFPTFTIPGHEKEMASLRALYWKHYEPAGPLIPLWDEWMSSATLWPALGSGSELDKMRRRWATAFSGRILNAEGYVLTEQHDGPAHAEGWPFPRWMDVGGTGWHFRGTGIPGYDAPLVTPANWEVTGGKNGDVNEKGWVVELDPREILPSPHPTGRGIKGEGFSSTIRTPPFSLDAKKAPWLRINWWAAGLDGADCHVEWTTKDQPEFTPENRAYFSPALSSDPKASAPNTSLRETRTMIPLYRLPTWKGTITSLRFQFANIGPAHLVIKSIHTACDTRQTVNNPNFIRGCRHYFLWTRDLTFLRSQIGRMRTAMRFMMSEFDTRQRKCVFTTWPGHEGRSGVRISPDGKKSVLPGEGIGGNYWDILPFGGEDALATIYYYDSVLGLAELEEDIIKHPEWCVARGADAFDPNDLRHHASEVRDYGTHRFWNEKTGRFGTVDLDGVLHDYGFTFLNNEAICFGFAIPGQAQSIRDWISGRRIVSGDSATAADIYHWSFGPRSTTRRNIDYYFWGWSAPESVPWGYQVQDGGAVLGFSYHDLMSRLQIEGPDSAWLRLKEILAWFDETQAAGGYREYYKDPSRGTMQGANVPGGLGLDKEFFESILPPQIMIYGFLGLRPTADGFAIAPHLPKEWPSLSVSRIHLHDKVLDIAVHDKSISLTGISPGPDAIVAEIPVGWQLSSSPTSLVTSRVSR
jgi:Glycosyl hydrolase family 65, C-terminal domain